MAKFKIIEIEELGHLQALFLLASMTSINSLPKNKYNVNAILLSA